VHRLLDILGRPKHWPGNPRLSLVPPRCWSLHRSYVRYLRPQALRPAV